MEKIRAITETKTSGSWAGMEGYKVITDKQEIELLIDSGQCCCENFGYFMSEDDFEGYIGADLLDIKITNKALKEEAMKENELDPNSNYFEGGVMFVNIETSKGTLQFVAYNEHNGYYGHEAKVISKQLTCSENL